MNVCAITNKSYAVRMRMRRMHNCGGGKSCVCVDGVDDPTVAADDAAHDGGDYDAASLMMPSK